MFVINLVKHAFKMLMYDPWATVRITLVPLVCLALIRVGFSLVVRLTSAPVSVDNIQPERVQGPEMLWLFPEVAVSLLAIGWAAVGWHRYVLVGAQPGVVFANLNTRYVLLYFVASIKIFLMVFVVSLPVVLLSGGASHLFGISGPIMPLVYAGLVVFCMAILLRFSLILPAAALDRPLSLSESWRSTKDYFGTFVGLALVAVLLNALPQASIGQGAIATVVSLLVDWLSFAMWISILTSLYGVCVEKRTL